MQQRRNDYTDRRTLKVLVCSWNIDACKPSAIDKSAHPDDQQFLANWLGAMKPDEPSIIVVGLQEVVDLESKKVTAKTLFRHTMWRDRIAKMVSISAGDNHRYRLVASHGMVGLFSLVFVRETEMPFIRDVYITQVKTGFKGLHGNKGAIICRVIHGASSLCFVNCHLAAGDGPVRDVLWANGGDGSRVMDHSIVFFSGDLNYRISRPRDEVEKLIVAKDWDALLRHDQLNDQFINYPTFALRNLIESPPPRFAPTYKYNVGTTKYDTSLKKRTPAWCDRILFRRGSGIRPLQYQRHENLLSDHRPISGAYEVPVYR
ncbi:DNase I-like protein, partial [Ramicandelaber brevisporus]